MPKVLAGMGLQKKVAESQIIHVWQNVMDPVVTAHAQPAGLVRGTVFITVDSNTWLSELVRYRRKEILERLQHAVGSDQVQRLSFRLG